MSRIYLDCRRRRQTSSDGEAADLLPGVLAQFAIAAIGIVSEKVVQTGLERVLLAPAF